MFTNQPCLSTADVARRLGVTPSTVWRWIDQGHRRGGKLLAFQAGSAWRVTEKALADFLERCNPEAWRQAAGQQEVEQKQGRYAQEKLRHRLNGKGDRYGV